MQVDEKRRKLKEGHFGRKWIKKWEKKGFREYVIDGFPYLFPPLINRPRCSTYNPDSGCIYCGNKTFAYYSKGGGKKYYQCKKCGGINH